MTVLEAIQEEKVTDMQIVPTQLSALLSHPDLKKYELNSLNRIYYAASPCRWSCCEGDSKCSARFLPKATGKQSQDRKFAPFPKKPPGLGQARLKSKRCWLPAAPSLGVHVRVVDKENRDVVQG